MRELFALPLVASVALLPGFATAERTCGAVASDAGSPGSSSTTCKMPLGVLLAQTDTLATESETVDPVEPSDVDAGGWLDRAKQAVQDAGREIGEAATATGRSAAEYLSDNPDLNRQVLEFGQDLGVPGFGAAPASGARLDATLGSDGQLHIEAAGLPGNQEVHLGWLDQERFVALETLRTGDNGRIDTMVAMPADLTVNQQVTLAVETADRRLRLASDPITVER
ncbi:hypothetical protein ABID21_001610 [Pseudorhizobium tarimense]|uniref:Uncharacterized protein n=1 Tax=Pseudorhizobium tarimense TaxID=1079109 RepID=A0ABV2H4M6_9HYPH|nr:hypothetical protein [Pseudorhizobium tarimense]MCJ8518724.1 hypothetical protein [Pseudorhizobium tarimense]